MLDLLVGLVSLGVGISQCSVEVKRFFEEQKERKRKKKQEAPLQAQERNPQTVYNYYYSVTVTRPIYIIHGTPNLHQNSHTPILTYPTQSSRPQPSATAFPTQEPFVLPHFGSNQPSLSRHDAHTHTSLRTTPLHQNSSRSVGNPGYTVHQWRDEVSQDQIGGFVDALVPPQSDARTHSGVTGIRIGSDPNPHNSVNLARLHWRYFEQKNIPSTVTPSIAVVCWELSTVDMFVLCNGLYYRNYQVKSCNVNAFLAFYYKNEIFSGEIVGGRLNKCNREVKFLEPLDAKISTNSWLKLGLVDANVSDDEYRDVSAFVEITLGAVFGLVSCLYTLSSKIAIDIKPSTTNPASKLVAYINSHPCPSSQNHKSPAFHFSVLSFNTRGWAKQNVLLV